MTDGERFLVPRLGVRWEDVEGAMADLGAVEEEPEDEDDLFAWTLDGCAVSMYEDAALHVEQLVVRGPDCDAVAARIRDRLPAYTPADMPGLFAEVANDDQLDGALNILALVAPEQAEPALVELFRRGLGHGDELIRQAALIALSVPSWPQLRGDVQRLASADPDADVRDVAASVLETMDQRA